MALAGTLSLDLQRDVGLLRPAPGLSPVQHPLPFQSKQCFVLIL